MRKKLICFPLLLLLLATSGCKFNKEMVAFNHNGTARNPSPTSTEEQINYELYHKDGIEACYPKFVVGSSEEQINQWNKIIFMDFEEVLQIYSFNPFPELTPTLTDMVPTILNISCDIKSNNSQGISIFYTAAFNSPYSAHPTDLVYTTNINKPKSERLKLGDLVKLNSDFVTNFREWDFKSVEEGNVELNQAIRDYMSNMSDEDLLMGFKASDQINSENVWGIYSYLTPYKLGISISVPNYIGDHVEFERDFSELEDFLVPGFVWE